MKKSIDRLIFVPFQSSIENRKNNRFEVWHVLQDQFTIDFSIEFSIEFAGFAIDFSIGFSIEFSIDCLTVCSLFFLLCSVLLSCNLHCVRTSHWAVFRSTLLSFSS